MELGPVVVNQVDGGPTPPDADGLDFGRLRAQIDDARAAATFRRARLDMQHTELERVREAFDTVVTLPWVPVADLDADAIGRLAAGLADTGDRDPDRGPDDRGET